jgi:hypothetical protein
MFLEFVKDEYKRLQRASKEKQALRYYEDVREKQYDLSSFLNELCA